MASKEQQNTIEKRRQEYEKELNKKIKGEKEKKVPPQDDKSSAEPTRKPIKIKNNETAYEKYIYDKQDKSEKMLDKLNASFYNTPKSMANRGRTLGLNTRIIDNYTENPKRQMEMSYAVPLYYTQNLPEGWRHNVVGMDDRHKELIGLSYWTGPLKYKDSGFKKPFTIMVTIFDYPSKKRLEEEREYYELTNYKGRYRAPLVKNLKKVARLMDKFERNLNEKIRKRKKDLEEDAPGGKSLIGEEGALGVKKRVKKPSKIFGDKWGDLKVGGRKRKTRKKRGANYKGRVIFLDFNIEKMKESGIIPEIYTYADNLNLLHKYRVLEDNGRVLRLMHIDDKEYKGLNLPMSAVENELVTIQIIPKKMGGRRSRKNKRSKKRRGKRKTRKKQKKRR